ncbi:ubiquinone biosynthesis protein [Acetoanaerobium pronyense]|uniref:Ubiquinone biosynthesis protein n=1 Tax=Acetoanaerobium pronyense TaxID=1482736 RepID=A0ABS4KIL7_9FIRM|nr:AarF/UbiB family protein [Acetoanaerobium pronyense]MBP2027628.1 ubiquinone biosynthesis protein [Acetoanaerobium pronyense]
MKFPTYKPKYRYLKRYKEIIQVFAKYGFTFLAEKLNVDGIVGKISGASNKDILNMSVNERIKNVLEELGVTFIKLGQILSTRIDIIDIDLAEELSKLQDNVKCFSFDEAREIFEEEIGLSLSEVFYSFNEVPIASASIGQVYEGILRSGEKVIIKIQKPNIEEVIKTDIEILKGIAKLLDDNFKDIGINLSEIADEFSTQLLRELDYTFEGRNCEKFREIYISNKDIYIPSVNWEFTSDKVLMLEQINGIKISDLKVLTKPHYDKKKIAKLWIKTYMEQIFINGFFHGDPHPGNIFVLERDRIAFIDFGIVGILDRLTLDFVTEIFLASIDRDVEKIITNLLEMDAISRDTDMRKVREDLTYYIHYYYSISLNQMNISEMLTEFLKFARANKLKLPSQFSILIKALITLEGGVRKLDSEFSLSEVLKEFSKEYYKNKINPQKLLLESRRLTESLFSDLKVIPRQLRVLLRNLEKNNIKMSIDDISFMNLEKSVNHMTNLISMSLIISALLMGSSLVITTKIEPTIWGYPVLGILGYLIAIVMGLALIISIVLNPTKYKR